jgi:enterochelin esterase-like enzyme/drug/metabolite transporter (DMT)-like permease
MHVNMRRRIAIRLGVALAALTLGITGLAGAYSYWESYYLHRGFKAVALVKGARRGHLLKVEFNSPALGRQADYLAYLPPGYHAGGHYPVYYLLHGSPGRPSVYLAIVSIGVRMDNLVSEHRMRPMILVFPDGRIGGNPFSDSEWANTPAGNYENYVLDVVRDVDGRFATNPSRAHRVIAGFSAGAYGATNIALHHLAVFGGVQSWSGYYRQSRSGVFAHASPAALAYNSPQLYVRTIGRQLATEPLRAFLFTGRDDNASPQVAPMADALAARGARVSYALYHGGHDWQLWAKHVNQMLILASRDATVPLTRGNGRAHTLTPGVVALPHGLGRHHHHPHRRHHRRSHRPRVRFRLAPPLSPTGPFLSAGLMPVVPPPPHAAHRGPRHRLGVAGLLLGLLLALGSAAVINLGFLLQHRGLGETDELGLAAALRRAWRNPTWLGGQLLGWIGFAVQIVAVAIAPLSLVQSFAAGGLALSVPLAAWLFGHRINRIQVSAVLLIAAGLAVLPIGYGTGRDHLHGPTLGVAIGLCAVLGVALSAGRRPWLRALAAGVFYGLADAAIKAVSVDWSAHGASALISGWTVVAAIGTFGGFLAFQAALRHGSAITAISLMNALTALVALACGALAFAESLGTNTVAVIAHLAAIAVVLGCVPLLAGAQAEMASIPEPSPDRPGPRPLQPTYESLG